MAAALKQIPDLLAEGSLEKGVGSAPKVSGTREAPIPLRIDPLDLSMPSRPGSLAVALLGLWPHDQIGHLAVATELEFWARDWAEERRERIPLPTVPLLAQWLLDRLDWACQHHYALDEFASKVRGIHGSLMAAAGRFDAPVETLSAPCPTSGMLALYRDRDIERVACGCCSVLMTEDEYVDYSQRLIKENPS
jgi:hypothetical protein